MEKFGLFDLIEKFNTTADGKKDFVSRKTTERSDAKKEQVAEIIGAPPQLVMNAKMRDFVVRHDKTVAAIRKEAASGDNPSRIKINS